MSHFLPLWLRCRSGILLVLALWSALAAAQTPVNWPLWDSFRRQTIQSDGRVIERRVTDRTTSEGQAYALFFALVANDRRQFEVLLSWTVNNLADGNMHNQQPAWLWGMNSASQWRVLDANPAADADFWLAYTLIQAGHLWQVPDYTALGLSLLRQIQISQQVALTGFGPSILPARHGFVLALSRWRLNPSYFVPQQLRVFAQVDPAGPWQAMLEKLPVLLRKASPAGFVPDWIVYDADRGWQPDIETGPIGSYDAIRMYLWVGMMDPADPSRAALLRSVEGMRRALQTAPSTIESIHTVTGAGRGKTPAGFTAALLPYLVAQRDAALAERLLLQLRATQQKEFLSAQSAYYDQVLALFGLGFIEKRFRFNVQGELVPSWVSERR